MDTNYAASASSVPCDYRDIPSTLVLGFGDLGTWGLGTGLVNIIYNIYNRYHCETVMGSMVASSLDSVDTSPRPDLVSRGVYTRFHGPLADMLAIFTETLSLMLSGNFYLNLNYVTTLNIQDRLSELTV